MFLDKNGFIFVKDMGLQIVIDIIFMRMFNILSLTLALKESKEILIASNQWRVRKVQQSAFLPHSLICNSNKTPFHNSYSIINTR